MKLLRHEPSRGIGGETDKRQPFARRAAVPSGGNAVNITEDVRKYAAEPSGATQIIQRMTRRASQQAVSEEEALQRGMEEKSKEFVKAGSEVYAKA